MRRYCFHCVLVGLLLATPAQYGSAQEPPKQRRRQFVEGLLKAFIDSQLVDDDQPRRTAPAAGTPNRNQLDATRPPTALGREASRKFREAGRLLTQASDEMANLVGALQGDIYRAAGVRQLLALAMNVNADAAVLSRRLARATDVEALREPLRKLDQDWRTLEYRLSQTPNLSPNTLGYIARVKQFEEKLVSMFDVAPQVDLQEVSRTATQMNSSIRSLLEDIRFEVVDVATANRLLQEGRDSYERSRALAQLARTDVPYSTLRREYEQLEAEWLRYEARLRTVNNRFVQRQVQRINDSVRSLHGLLYLDVTQVDRDDLAYTMQILRRDTDQLLGGISLKMLSELPAARNLAVAAAMDFDIACQDFTDVLQAGDDLDVVRELYIYVYDEWQRLKVSLQGVSSPSAGQSIRDIERSLTELQAMLRIQFDFDRTESIELAASLASLAQHVQDDIREVFSRPNRYPRDFQTSSLEAAAQFQATARKLHSGLSDGEKLRDMKVRCDEMASAWNNLDRMIPRFRQPDGLHLASIRRKLTPQVVKMQTLLTL